MELVDVTDSKSVGLIPRVGSSPTTGTTETPGPPLEDRVFSCPQADSLLWFSPAMFGRPEGDTYSWVGSLPRSGNMGYASKPSRAAISGGISAKFVMLSYQSSLSRLFRRHPSGRKA